NAAPHRRATAAGPMNPPRNLLATMLVATFGAIVAGSVAAATGASGGTLGGPLDHAAVEAFRRVFFGVTGTLAISLIAILLLEEKPLQTGVEPADEGDGRDGRHHQSNLPQPSGDARHRLGRAAAAVHGLDRQHDPGERTADHRARVRRCARPALADYHLSPRRHRRDAALWQDCRYPWPPFR